MPRFRLSSDVAIDLGTANTLICIPGNELPVVDEPSIVARNRATKKAIAIGSEALLMHERTNKNIETIRPLNEGVIGDFQVAEQLIRGLIRKVRKGWMASIRQMVICIPSGITEVEKRAVRESAEHAGARKVFLIAEPMAAAIGIGMDINAPIGNMIVDIGGGTTEIAVISMSGIVVDESIRTGGDDMDQAIVQFCKKHHNLLIGNRTAERIKIEIGSAAPLEQELELAVKGRDLITGIPRVRTIESVSIREALADSVSAISRAVVRCLEQTPPELGADILERGIQLTGGGAKLKGIDEAIKARAELPVYVADNPLYAVVRGTYHALMNMSEYEKVLI